MIAGLSLPELAELAALLVATGALAGFLAGIFGVGGGAVLVPVLYECFRIAGVPLDARMPLCIGTSLAIIIPTSIRSWRAHARRGGVDMAILKQWALPVLFGIVLGSVIARYAPERLFKYVFVAVAWSAAIRFLVGKDSWRLADDLPKGPLMRVYGLGIGLLSTLMGIGGGLLSNLLMAFYGRPIHQAIGTSAGLGVLISIPGALGYISIIGALLVTPMSLLVAPLGVRVAHLLPKRRLEMAFGIYLLIVSSRFVVSVLTGY
jgi:uncharacterized membrane protein YfcA